MKTLTDYKKWFMEDGTQIVVEFWSGEVAGIELLSYPTDAKQTLAKSIRGYKGIYSNEPVAEEEVTQLFKDLKNTKLGTPAEMLNFVFLVRDVPRSWTHQAVRTRIGSAVVQESTRFIGIQSVFKIYTPMSVSGIREHGGINKDYKTSSLEAIELYCQMVKKGIPSQDARNSLPHSLLTHMYWSINLRALMGIYDVRWCCQAEPGTWIPVMRQIKDAIYNTCGWEIANFLSSPITRGEPDCGFNASFDRSCEWRDMKGNKNDNSDL